MSKKVIFISKYLKSKATKKSNKSSVDNSKPLDNVIHMQAHSLSKNKKDNSLKVTEYENTTNNVIAFNKFKKDSQPTQKTDSVTEEANNVIFMQDRFKQNQKQRKSQQPVINAFMFSIAPYGVAAAFLFMFGLSFILFQQRGANRYLALDTGLQNNKSVIEKRDIANDVLAEPFIINGRRPTQKEKNSEMN